MRMRVVGRYEGVSRSYQGDLVVSFTIEDETVIEELERGKDKKLELNIKRYSEHRSLNANRYFWDLCEQIAIKLRKTKNEVYIDILKEVGVFVDIEIDRNAIGIMQQKFRYIEEVHYAEAIRPDRMIARCYWGSSTYTKNEFARLIDEAIFKARENDIRTWSPEELEIAMNQWRESHEGY